jgi:hypothetical protein
MSERSARKERPAAVRKATRSTAKAHVERTTHVNRSQAHTSAVGRRRQRRRDTK